MRNVRIYQPGLYATGQELALGEAQSQHVAVVLRMRPGDSMTLFCGDNREFEARIHSVVKKKVFVSILNETWISRESPKQLHLVQAMSKTHKMEWIVQKAVELGVSSITLLMTERSVVKLKEERLERKLLQWESIAIGACEQSGRNQLPSINIVEGVDEYLQRPHQGDKFILSPQATKTWRDYSFEQTNVVLLVGPEGGFSEKELSAFLSYHYNPLSIGPRVLRTETAAIAGLSLLQAVCGDL